MSTETHRITVGVFEVDVVRKAIKNMHVAVYPPTGRVRVSVPLVVSDEAVRLAVMTKAPWIKRQQAKFKRQDRQSRREYISGESHFVFGKRYRLNVVYDKGPGRIIIRNKSYIDLHVPEGTNTVKRDRIFREWYRKQLKALIPSLIEKWEGLINVDVADWGVKKMKTKWGSCNTEAHRIWLNLELAKKPELCLEYIIVHEMVHLLEKHHNDRFKALMDGFMPHWKQAKAVLEQFPLVHENWDY